MKRLIDSIPLGSEDSDSDQTEDDDVRSKISYSSEENNEENKETAKEKEEVELLVTKKKIKVGKTFGEPIICSKDGLSRIYNEFPKVFKFKGIGHEASDLKRLDRLYKEWAFQLYPGIAYPDLLKTVWNMSSKPLVKSTMTDLREKERDRYLVHFYYFN